MEENQKCENSICEYHNRGMTYNCSRTKEDDDEPYMCTCPKIVVTEEILNREKEVLLHSIVAIKIVRVWQNDQIKRFKDRLKTLEFLLGDIKSKEAKEEE